jgi:hypothetical protein
MIILADFSFSIIIPYGLSRLNNPGWVFRLDFRENRNFLQHKNVRSSDFPPRAGNSFQTKVLKPS